MIAGYCRQVAARDSASLPDTLTELTAATALRMLLASQNEVIVDQMDQQIINILQFLAKVGKCEEEEV